eukprot:UN09698
MVWSICLEKMEEQGAPATSIKQYYNKYIRLPYPERGVIYYAQGAT